MASHLLIGWLRPVRLDTSPALLAIALLDLLARPQPPVSDTNHEAALEHEGTAAGADLDRRQLGVARALVALGIRAVAAHDVVQAGAAGHEAASAATLGVVAAADEAHELAHGVAVVPGRAEGVLADQPARREDDEVGHGGARNGRRRREHREDGRVWVVVRDGADGVEAAQIVLVGVVVALPGDDVEWRVGLASLKERVVHLDGDGEGAAALGGRGAKVLAEVSDGRLEVARVGQAVGADGAQLREDEVALVELQRVASGRAGDELHLVLDAAGDDGNLHGPHQQPAELGADVEVALLGHNQEVAVGRVEGRVGVHALAGGVDEHAQPLLERGIAGAGHEPHAGHKVQVARLIVVEGVPPQLVGDVAKLGGVGTLLLGAGRLGGGLVGRVGARGQDAIQPGLLVLVAGGCEGGSGELLCVEAVGGLLGRVLGDGEGALDSFGSGDCVCVWLVWSFTANDAVRQAGETYSRWLSNPFWYLYSSFVANTVAGMMEQSYRLCIQYLLG